MCQFCSYFISTLYGEDIGKYQGMAIEKENKLQISHHFIKCRVSVSFGNYKAYATPSAVMTLTASAPRIYRPPESFQLLWFEKSPRNHRFDQPNAIIWELLITTWLDYHIFAPRYWFESRWHSASFPTEISLCMCNLSKQWDYWIKFLPLN